MKELIYRLIIWGIAVGAFLFTVINRLYRVSSREGVPMFSAEAFALGWPYWLGGLLGFLLLGIYWWVTRTRQDGP